MKDVGRWLVGWAWFLTAAVGLSAPEPPQPTNALPLPRLSAAQVETLELETPSGTRVRPWTKGDSSVQVFIFLSNECPIANRYAPEFRRLHAAFRNRGVRFWFVHASPDETPSAVARHAKEYSLPAPVLLDPDLRLTPLLGVTVTPEAAVVDRQLQVVYRGRIDDRFVRFGRERARATRSDLKEALEAVLAGRTVELSQTKAIGCAIPQQSPGVPNSEGATPR